MERISAERVDELWLRKVGFCFQTFNLIGIVTELENVKLPILHGSLASSQIRRRAHELLAQRASLSTSRRCRRPTRRTYPRCARRVIVHNLLHTWRVHHFVVPISF